MEHPDFDIFLREFERLQHDLQAIKQKNERIEEQQHLIKGQIYCIQKWKELMQQEDAQEERVSFLEYVWEANLHFAILAHDLFLAGVNLDAHQYFGLHQRSRMPLLNYIAIQCHEFLTRFNAALFHEKYWRGVKYITEFLGHDDYQSTLQNVLREFNRTIDRDKEQLASIRNAVSHRPFDIIIHHEDMAMVEESFILSVSKRIENFCRQNLSVYQDMFDMFSQRREYLCREET